jgi:uncharacterized protein YdeI (YjbR/CyaY-like superfamily)
MSADSTPSFYAKDRQAWREWLQEHHDKEQSVWLIYYKKAAKKSSISYSDAVDEALCFGWIDSKAKPIDAETYMQFFSRRKAKSVWSKINKKKVERLIEQQLMTKAGYDSIAIAQQNGSWTILDEAEQLIVPDDLAMALEKNPTAQNFFGGLSRSDKRNILQWLVLAKRAETRQNRINEIVELAGQHMKPKQFR